MQTNIIYARDDYCWAIYDGDTKKLIASGRHQDPVFMLRSLGFFVEVRELMRPHDFTVDIAKQIDD
jgi:hypothetical protein